MCSDGCSEGGGNGGGMVEILRRWWLWKDIGSGE